MSMLSAKVSKSSYSVAKPTKLRRMGVGDCSQWSRVMFTPVVCGVVGKDIACSRWRHKPTRKQIYVAVFYHGQARLDDYFAYKHTTVPLVNCTSWIRLNSSQLTLPQRSFFNAPLRAPR